MPYLAANIGVGILNADIDAAAAIVGSKIVDVVNADVDGSAAIATSKLSGALTSVTSHGLATSATTDTTNASNLASGTVPTARLGSGTASSSTFLRGDSTYAAAGGGKILQVVQHQWTTMYYYASVGSWRTTAVSGAITPSATSSKILVMLDSNYGASNYGHMRLRRASSVIAVGTGTMSGRLATTSGGMIVGSNNMAAATKQTVTWLDSPSSTSSRTYDVQVIDSYSANHVRLNGGYDDGTADYVGRCVSSLTLLEIDGS